MSSFGGGRCVGQPPAMMLKLCIRLRLHGKVVNGAAGVVQSSSPLGQWTCSGADEPTAACSNLPSLLQENQYKDTSDNSKQRFA
eukprot:5847630-Amphidinium_carterae.1